MTFFKYLLTAAVTAITAYAASPAQAHDFWLEPENFAAAPGEDVNLFIKIGHPHDRMLWPVDLHRVISFRAFGPDGIKDSQSALSKIKRSKAVPLSFQKPGVYMITIETTQSFSELPAEQFNAYLDEESLTPIKLDRVRNRTTDEPGTELYSRRGKTLIQIGEPSDINPDYISRPVGMTLEIVPTQNPGSVKEGEMLRSTVYYRGLPVAGISLSLVDLSGDAGVVATAISDNSGSVAFKKPPAGAWMQHAVWSDPLEDTRKADYDTVFSSLSFYVP